jgi:diguanylate cyclase (GGDEF)-like protein/PAS domain S-box-containing protein
LSLGLLLLNLLVLALAVWSLYQSRLKYEESTRGEVRNLAQLLDHDISTSVRSIDLLLQVTVQEAQRQLTSGRRDATALNRFIERQLFQQPNLDSLGVSDALGNLTHGAGMVSSTRQSIADRDYFVRLRNEPGAGLVVSQPVQGRFGKRWIILLARAIRQPDGRFAGVAVGAIPLERFTQAFAQLDVGPGGSFALIDDERRLVTRYPVVQMEGGMIGMKFGAPELQAILKSGQKEGSFQFVSAVDGVHRMFAFRKIQGVPLNISVGQAADKYLAEWRREVIKTAWAVAVFSLVTFVLFWLTYRAWKSQEAAVAALKKTNRSLDAERHLNQTIIQSSPFAIYTRNGQGLVTGWNRAAEKLFGWRADEIVGKPMLTVPADKKQETDELRERVLRGENIIQLEVQRQKRDGTVFDLSTTLAPLRDESGAIDGYLAIAADITERKAAEKRIEFLAYRDVLTGLPNRLLLLDRFDQAVAFAGRTGTKVALAALDLDNFKTVNDSLGHAVGDALLREVAFRLGQSVRDTDTISRQGGDEFLIVLPDLRGMDAITPVLLKIRDGLQAPIEYQGNELSTSASIGIAIYPDDGRDFDTLLKKADTAMYQAKDAGRNSYRFFDAQMNTEAVEHLRLKNGMRRAIARGEFVLHYQPQIDLLTGVVVGAEALIRWNHPDLGMLEPARFIGLAEESGLIVPIGEWVIFEACRQAVAWRLAGLPPLVMAVNLSPVQFKRGEVERVVIDALKDSGLDAGWLELELTESILIHDTDQVLATVKRLKQLGVKLSIDDFGTGYSSLSYLKSFAVDKLKIDQSFVRDLASDPDDAAIIRAIIQMARSLNLKTIAEGVEDADMVVQLRIFECDEAQGYHFARPMPAQAFAAFLVQGGERQNERDGPWPV